ncbi:MAG: tRNA (adenosine(37)-N6)-threonylcarbamoyltransferase complex dimerization subunit type 1 TsaB [Crocinitomix sp.]|nr:tRNA (adenosine(37)-N6)-threonylcarbamoyltransferase complex dimerization subunit type 1 TsaB [Crocinitomix sp.]
MGLILCLETATKVCSLSLVKDGIEVATINHFSDHYSHSERLNGLLLDLLKQTNISLNDLDAVAISEGPGSYTGLRIGTSTAKGLCYALDIPLIAINSLKALAAEKRGQGILICPMFDARRMEVYSAIYDADMKELEATRAVVIDEISYQDFLAEHPICFIGPGAEKCQETLQHKNASFDLDVKVSAKGMHAFAHEKFEQQNFVDLAYFEPFYLKDFIAGTPKKIF